MTPITEKVQKVSLKRLHYAVMTDVDAETYGEVKTLTMPIELGLTPNFSEAGFDAGDRQVAYENQLDSISVTGQLADLPTEVQADWYGHKKSADGGLIMGTADEAKYLAVGFESGSKLVWLFKAKFKPTEETNATKKKGETAFKQYGFSGEALPLIDGTVKHTVRTDDSGVTATAETFFATVGKPTEPVPGP